MTTSSSHLSTQIIDQDTLFNRLQAGHTLVTCSSRLARVLTAQNNKWHIQRGDQQWPSPDIVSWNLWLDKLWETASLQGLEGTQHVVPGSWQLINLWESVLRDDSLARHLLRPESLATQLRDTRRLIREWCLDLRDSACFGDENENHGAFYHWNQAFENLYWQSGHRHGHADRDRLPDLWHG
jgi:hypothetical protein